MNSSVDIPIKVNKVINCENPRAIFVPRRVTIVKAKINRPNDVTHTPKKR